jgi:hypothetical protein
LNYSHAFLEIVSMRSFILCLPLLGFCLLFVGCKEKQEEGSTVSVTNQRTMPPKPGTKDKAK